MTTVAIHQPNFLPYPGFFYKMALADIFVLYDTAQFVRREYHNRNRVKSPEGTRWLTVPVKVTGFPTIQSVRTDNSQPWGERLWETVRACYQRAPHYAEYAPRIRAVLQAPDREFLAELNTDLIRLLARALGMRRDLCLASELSPVRAEDPSDRLIELTRAVGGDAYLSGAGALEYLDQGRFTEIGLRIAQWPEVQYPQLWGDFIPNLSIVDALFNCGAATAERLFGRATEKANA